MPKIKPPPKEWCKRCQERELAPNPRAPLPDPCHEKFARNVALKDMPPAKAYAESGMTSKSLSTHSTQGHKWLRQLAIRNRVAELSKQAVARDLKTRDWVDGQLKEVVDRCMQKKPVIVNGKHTGEWKFDARGANAALHLMGKDRGMFVERMEIIDSELSGKSPEEIAEMVAASAIELGRDFIRRLGEAVGLFEEHGKAVDGAKTPTVEPVSTIQ